MRGRRPWQWDEFKETAARRMPDRLYATLSPRGDFVVNLKTYIRMNEPEAVVLLYDRDTRTIGVRPSRLDVPNAILVHTRHARYNRVFRSRKFLAKHGIKIDRTVQFPTAEIDTDGVLILNLKEMVTATHMPRKLKSD
ncbi:MAG TPA: hypothetical protein VJ781_06980 [Pyrinomonadaceae bacterium]|nr:hypothetical protein [Pyrinomonadaceae bacterium]